MNFTASTLLLPHALGTEKNEKKNEENLQNQTACTIYTHMQTYKKTQRQNWCPSRAVLNYKNHKHLEKIDAIKIELLIHRICTSKIKANAFKSERWLIQRKGQK